MKEEFKLTDKQKDDSSKALFDFLYDNNNYCGFDYRNQITFSNRIIKFFNKNEIIASFISDITIKYHIPSERNILYIDNSEAIQPLAGKETFWPTKYIIQYENGVLIIQDNSIKIVVS